MGLAAFNRARREAAARKAKEQEQAVKSDPSPKRTKKAQSKSKE